MDTEQPPPLPDWAPGHHVSSHSRDADVDRHAESAASAADQSRQPDRVPSYPLNLPTYPIHDVWEEHTEENTYKTTSTQQSSSPFTVQPAGAAIVSQTQS